MQLTCDQENAIHHFNGPAIVVAGPGSGKTRVIIERVIFLVNEKGVPPGKIAVTTFTEKAASELKHRLSRSMGISAAGVHVSTIHSLCRFFLEQTFAWHAYGAAFEVLSAPDQALFIRAHKTDLKLTGRKGWRDPIFAEVKKGAIAEDAVASFYNVMTAHGISAGTLITRLEKDGILTHDAQRVIEGYDAYRKLLIGDKLVDFEELQRKVYALLMESPEARRALQGLFDYYLVDEYQDTNPLQDAIFRELTEKTGNLFVVGDVNQSIYAFRGATAENFSLFTRRYPQAREFFLTVNFRSTRRIVEASNRLIEGRIKESLEAKRGKGNPLILLTGADRDGAAELAVKTLVRLKEEGVIQSYGSAAFLCRTRSAEEPIIFYLKENAVPYVALGDGTFFDSPEIKTLIYLVSYLHQQEMLHDAREAWASWWDVGLFTNEVLGLSPRTSKALHALDRKAELAGLVSESDFIAHDITDKNDIRTLSELNRLRFDIAGKTVKRGLLESLYDIFRISGFVGRCLRSAESGSDESAETRLYNIAVLTGAVDAYERSMKRPGIKGLLEHLYQQSTGRTMDQYHAEKIDSAKVMTAHRSKGLEFPLVFVCGLTERGFPLAYRKNGDYCGIPIPGDLLMGGGSGVSEDMHYHEELRLFYVALTRAQDAVILTTSEKINVQRAKPSRFLKLIGEYITGKADSLESLESRYRLPEAIHSLSYSSVHTYLDCPYRYMLLYHYGFVSPGMYTQQLGIIVHNVIQRVHMEMKEGRTVSKGDLDRYIDEYWIIEGNPRKEAEDRRRITDHLAAYVEQARRRYRAILGVEQPFSFVGDSVIVKGKADLLAERNDGSVELVDFKASYKKGIKALDLETQLNIYRLCLGESGISALYGYAVLDDAYIPVESNPEKTAAILDGVASGIAGGDFHRNTESEFCVSGLCPFSFACKE